MWSSVSRRRRVALQAERRKVVAQRDQRLVVDGAGQVVRGVQEDLRLADALEQRVVLVRRPATAAGDATPPRVPAKTASSKRAGRRRLGRGDLQLRIELGRGRRVEQRRPAGRRPRHAQVPRARRAVGKAIGCGVMERLHRSSDPHFVRIGVDVDHAAVAAHPEPLAAAPWNIECAAELGRSSPRSPRSVPKGLPQRTQAKGSASRASTRGCLRALPPSASHRRGSSVIACSGQVLAHSPHCTQLASR